MRNRTVDIAFSECSALHQEQFQKIARKYLSVKCEIIAEMRPFIEKRKSYLKVKCKVD